MFGVFRNYDLSDKIFDSLLTAMAIDRRESIFFVGDAKLIMSRSLDLHDGRAVRNFASSSLGCEQMVPEPIHIDGGVLDLVVTDGPDLVWVRVGSPVRTAGYIAVS